MKQIIACVLLCWAIVLAADSQVQTTANNPVKFEKYVLNNGLRVLISENHASPVVSYAVYYNVGSRNEVPGRTGFAHLFEHMMFQGSQNVGRNEHHIWIGRAGGNDNGSTNNDRTNYFATVPANQLALALWTESDRMRSLKITPENLENQRATVKEEKKQSYDNQPYSDARAKLSELLFESFPYNHTVIGSMADLNAATLKDVQDFFDTYYAPNNAVLAIVGDCKTDEVKKLVNQYFATIPSQVPPPQVIIHEPPRNQEKKITLTDKFANVPAIFAGFNTVPEGHADHFALELLGDILLTGNGSRLYRRLVKDKELAVSVSGGEDGMRGVGYFSLNIMLNPSQATDLISAMTTVLAEAQAEFDKIKQSGVTPDELQKVKNRLRTAYYNGKDQVQRVAMQLCEFELFSNDASGINSDLQNYMKITLADINRVAKQYLQVTNRCVVNVLPANYKAPDESFRKTAPFNDQPLAYRFPKAEESTLSNGLKMGVFANPNMPRISLQLYFKGGAYDEPQELRGISTVLAAMLTEGSQKYPGSKIQERLDFLGAAINVNATPDQIVVNVSFLKEYQAEVLEILADVIVNPQFPEVELNKRIRNLQTRLTQQRANPLYLASEMLYGQVFGAHPYSHVSIPGNAPYVSMTQVMPTPESLTKIDRASLMNYHRQFFIPNEALLVVSGDVNRAAFEKQLEGLLANWQKGAAIPARTYDLPTRPSKRVLYLIDRPGSVQSYILMGNLLFNKKDPAYFPLLVGNKILGGGRHIGGGGFGRLFMNIREEKGWTYGAYSWLIPFQRTGLYVINTEVRTEVTAPAVKEIYKEIERIHKGDWSADDIRYTKAFLGSVLPLTQEGAVGIASAYAELKRFDLAADFWETYAGNVHAVTSEQMVKAAKENIALNDTILVVVGDAAKIETELKPLCDEVKRFSTQGQAKVK